MPDYRCCMLDHRGNLLFPSDIVAESLEAALRSAFELLRQTNEAASVTRRAYAFEVWAETSRIDPPTPVARQDGHATPSI
jgi:hypothetical protein